MSAPVEKMPSAMTELRTQLVSMEGQFKAALPAHIPMERFTRVLQTAIGQNPDLLKVERRSLWQAAMQAAQDGLLPDGRDGALVVYRDRNRGPIAQWMPMVGGIRKKVRNSGELANWEVHVVYENDEFAFELGDEPYIRHRPTLSDRGHPIAAYSIATLKSGEKSREVMTVGEINKVRNVSRAKDSGPWTQWWEEMARKTVARRHAKTLPMSTDLDDLIRRDDALYAFDEAKKEALEKRKPTLADNLVALAGGKAVSEATPAHDEAPAHIIEGEVEDAADEPVAADLRAAPEDDDEGDAVLEELTALLERLDHAPKGIDPSSLVQVRAYLDGMAAAANGMSRRAVPPGYRDSAEAASAWARGWDHEKGQG